jgi:hypothetical protein
MNLLEMVTCSSDDTVIHTFFTDTVYLGINEYRATRRQTDWPRKGLLKSHVTSLLLYPSV